MSDLCKKVFCGFNKCGLLSGHPGFCISRHTLGRNVIESSGSVRNLIGPLISEIESLRAQIKGLRTEAIDEFIGILVFAHGRYQSDFADTQRYLDYVIGQIKKRAERMREGKLEGAIW
jgi:hypothetical protein